MDGVNFVFAGPPFDFHAPLTGPANTPLNGNLAAHLVVNLGGILSLPAPLLPGGTIYLRRLDVAASVDHELSDRKFRGVARHKLEFCPRFAMDDRRSEFHV